MKSEILLPVVENDRVAPAWGRGLKYQGRTRRLDVACRPRMGAWIEIASQMMQFFSQTVAPAWGRGLKFYVGRRDGFGQGRPRMGAWIEIR